MSNDRDGTPLIDLAAIVIAPILVMMMVGSLVFFLIDVLYRGNYSDRLLYTFFFFVFGSVLIARLSIQFGRMYSMIYAAGLGGACFLAMLAFVEYPPGIMKAIGPVVNIGLMALVWWSADRLTWDCTHFEDERRASGRGVLSAAGIDPEPAPQDDEPEQEADEKSRKPTNWWERFQAYRAAQKKKPHTPGVWILYFSLAALPLFALGQSLISPDDAARRRATFLEMAVYVGSGLGLLVTTSLLGLQRYLEQRNARIPPIMTAGWLGLGAGLIVLFLVVGALLPRPHSETPWFGMKQAGSSDRQSSKYAVVRDKSAGKGVGAEGQKTEAGQGKSNAQGGQKGGSQGNQTKGNPGSSQNKDGSGQQGQQGQDGNKGNSSGDDRNSSQNKSQSQQSPKGSDSNQRNKDKQDNDRNEKNGSKSSSPDEKSDDQSDGSKGEQADSENDRDEGSSSRESSGSGALTKALETMSSLVKWVVWILVALAVIAGLLLFGLKWLAPFTDWARNLLNWLKGLLNRGSGSNGPESIEEASAGPAFRPPSFAEFSNPFTDGTARRRTPAELVEYTFFATDAWAWDQEMGRKPGETPAEFAIRLGHHYEELDDPLYHLAQAYTRVLYSRTPVAPATLDLLRSVWEHLEAQPVATNHDDRD